MIQLAQPDLTGNEAAYVAECIATGWISSHGRFVDLFEDAFARFTGTAHAISTSNGTTALHLALVGLGVGPGDEVIVPTVTYVATANAVAYCGATPVLVDVMPGALTIDIAQVTEVVTPRTKGVIAVHLYGIPAAVDELRAWCDERGLFLLEDAAEAHGARVGQRRVGSIGHAGMFSFFGNKIITTGEGGMVTTDDGELAARLRQLRGQGMDPGRRYWFPIIGFNYRMTNIEAAIGLAQLERFDEFLAVRTTLEKAYRQLLSTIPGITIPPMPAGVHTVPWLANVVLREGGVERRDAVMAALSADGIDTRPMFYPLHAMPPFASSRSFPVADEWTARGISLPLHTAMTAEDVASVCSRLSSAVAAS